MANEPSIDSHSSTESPISLDTLYIYQNPNSGKPSAHPIPIRQLIHLAVPLHNRPTLLTPQTLVIRLLEDQSYCKNGWKPLFSTPIVQQAMEQWFYEKDGTSEGPVAARDLPNTDLTLRVYSSSVPSWKPIGDLPLLRFALEALKPPKNEVVVNPQKTAKTTSNQQQSEKVQDELEAFLNSEDEGEHNDEINTSENHNKNSDDNYDDGASLHSDNGTRYVKDERTGNWVHEALATSANEPEKKANNQGAIQTSKRKRKANFSAKKAKCWIYITGLPPDTDAEELKAFFSKAGIIDLNPETQEPKIKLYRKPDGTLKGDASLCYANTASVDLALTLYHEAPLRRTVKEGASHILSVERAKFEQQGSEYKSKQISLAKRKVARLAAAQAVDWDDGEINGRITGGRKGLRIVVLKHLFVPPIADTDLEVLEREIRQECESSSGDVEKVTVFASNPDGIFVVKFSTPGAASQAVQHWEGKTWKSSTIKASFWDGVTDFSFKDEARERVEEVKRQEEFGDWLEQQELPEELRLKNE